MQAKVWNRNVHPFKQDFKGQLIEIPAGGHILMDYHEGVSFKSAYFEPLKDGMDQQDPKSYKMIEVEKIADGQKPEIAFRSAIDGSYHPTKEALADYEITLSKGAPIDEDGAKIVVRSPGRPKKNQEASL